MKLLNYTSARYLLYTAMLFLISIPVFYIALDKIFTDSIDGDLQQLAEEMPAQMNIIRSERDFALWKALDNDIEITDADSTVFHPEPFTRKKRENGELEAENFRVLQKKVYVLGKSYIIQIESSLIEKEDLIKTILFIQLGLFFLLLFGGVGINYFINRNVWRPFYESLSYLSKFNIENKTDETLNAPKIQEFRQLNESIEQLTTSVRMAYLSQKEFIENASHELQTPLTNLKFKLELLLQDKDLSYNQSLLISEMYHVIEQLDELNKNLLLLTKIENRQFTFTELVNPTEAINEVVSDLSLIAESKSQRIEIKIGDEVPLLDSNRILFKILLRNLILNALQHSAANSVISVFADKEMLQIINPGDPLDIRADCLFRRFDKNGFSKGTGLGLSIVKTISDLYYYKISYEYSAGYHHFVVRWN